MATATKKSRITHRICNVKKHTLGYVIDGKNCRRSTAVNLAKQGRLEDVQVVGDHIQVRPTSKRRRLLDLPEKLMRNFK